MTPPTDWWNGFFTGLFADFWQAAMPADATRADADFFEKSLRLRPGSRVLDAPCGHGRHSLELGRRGFRVTGLDFSAELLAAARHGAERERLAVEWVEADMRELPWRGEFDAAFCAGSSFGFFDDVGNKGFLGGVARSLRPGGRFLLDSGWIAETLFPHFHERLEMEVSDLRFQAENRYDPIAGRVENRFTVRRGERSESRPAGHRVYTCRQLVDMLAEMGFGEFEAFGSLEGEPFALGSRRMLLVATKG